MDANHNCKGKFDAEKFVDNLFADGQKNLCDATWSDFNRDMTPTYYDSKKFYRAKKFYYDNIIAIFHAKLLGLIAILSCHESTEILMMTNKSSTPETAYVRYMRTIYHVHTWYTNDFAPGSKSFKSLTQIKSNHNAMSDLCHSKGIRRCSQKDMSATLFGFMGFILLKTEEMGIYKASKEDLEAYIHFWRVIGYSLGIEDRFNICRESIEETKDVCQSLFKRLFLPNILKMSKDYILMSNALVQGMSGLSLLFNENVYRAMLYDLVKNDDIKGSNHDIKKVKNTIDLYSKLSWLQKFIYNFISFMLSVFRYDFLKRYFNELFLRDLLKTRKSNRLAYYKFGPDSQNVLPACLR